MKLKLFKKYFLATVAIIFFSLFVMLMILSFVFNSYIAKSKHEALTKSCNEAVEYIKEVNESGKKEDTKSFVKVLNTISNISDADIFVADYPSGEVAVCGCDEFKTVGNCMHSVTIISKEDLEELRDLLERKEL